MNDKKLLTNNSSGYEYIRPDTLILHTAQANDRDLLWNVFQKYMYEMSWLYLDEMDEAGNYPYEHFDDYFYDPKREAILIYNDDTLVGFAMLCPYSCANQTPDYTMAEYTIFPAYRRKHLALESVRMILKDHPGKWEIKYSEKNSGANRLWDTVAAPFDPEIIHLNEEESVLVFECS